MDKRYTVRIKQIIDECDNVKSFIFDLSLKAKPGQFVMLTNYGVGEKPFSIASNFNNQLMITIKKFGNFTEELFKLNVGDILSIRGAYGTAFSLKGNNVLLIGGGVGVPPLFFLAQSLKGKSNITFINAAKNKNELVLDRVIKDYVDKYIIATDDGSAGIKGNAIEVAENLIKQNNFDMIYAAGPEIMLVKGVEMCEKYNLNYEFSFERYMKCGVGLCGQCVCEPSGLVLCVEGPVLKPEQIKEIKEFGKFKRIATGNRKYFGS
ncbi:MAG TPA: dihydroorotate dehydrogenase electron transfer subunit [Ignavibacteriales bacterium]|nr:dihydroorotate dehydrogenase electron transfer subunit [Ignavibacteriales bacterium]HOL81105.1 dihydroorotate dehydrogenase electron transfer subunit [Ignavibacteriales bacterium]HOM65209.1 dihydroorotate dehydrogenase electron transfer subunit [Ignavibacteriales bacterium]HPD66501.1 dihydroorotate dehydrogenase electron transfer subunit [Ignavibacteriales bacterium]HPP33539.1 dihydroorotate dehydrogenase electron transfer subunit [Ignavibacteriales bacterium]